MCLGIAGVDRPHDEAVIRGILRRLGHRETARVVNDAAIALVAGAPGAGRASWCWPAPARSPTAPTARAARARSGGYGFLLADEGSGYWLGHQALRAAVRAADGRGPDTRCWPLVFEALGVGVGGGAGAARLREGAAQAPHRRPGAARRSRPATAGDAVAAALLEQAARELALGRARGGARSSTLGDEPYPGGAGRRRRSRPARRWSARSSAAWTCRGAPARAARRWSRRRAR